MRSSSMLGSIATALSPSYAPSHLPPSHPLQQVLKNAHSAPCNTYPTDLTQGIVPKQIHSHNDYWRPVPFYSALSVGAISVEADVWLSNGTLYVGHEQGALTAERTLDSLYIQPILSVLHHQNRHSSLATSGPTKNGVYDTSPGQTLYLFVDVKTDGPEAWPAVIHALQPLRSAGYLTTYTGRGVTSGAVTVMGTGNTPLDHVQGVSPRDYFYDAPLALLGRTCGHITADVSPIASTAFSAQLGVVRNGRLDARQAETLRSQIQTARARGIGARYWDQPNWPADDRNAVYEMLRAAGVALLNVDDLESVVDL